MPRKPELSHEDQALRERIGLSIRAVSAMHGKKPADLIAVSGISQAQQYRIEGGEAAPDAIYLVKVAAYLGISLDELCGVHAPVSVASKPASQKARADRPSIGSINQVNTGANSLQIGSMGSGLTDKG